MFLRIYSVQAKNDHFSQYQGEIGVLVKQYGTPENTDQECWQKGLYCFGSHGVLYNPKIFRCSVCAGHSQEVRGEKYFGITGAEIAMH